LVCLKCAETMMSLRPVVTAQPSPPDPEPEPEPQPEPAKGARGCPDCGAWIFENKGHRCKKPAAPEPAPPEARPEGKPDWKQNAALDVLTTRETNWPHFGPALCAANEETLRKAYQFCLDHPEENEDRKEWIKGTLIARGRGDDPPETVPTAPIDTLTP